MNKYQWTALAVAAVNLILIMLYPPYDYIPATRAGSPTFDGFYLVFGDHGPRQLNAGFLQLELFVVLINAAIAWLLFRDRPSGPVARAHMDWQRVVLFGVGVNLLLVLLFPPMQSHLAVTRAALPSFDGFYFLFGEYGKRVIVTEMLYVEIVFVLINGGILWLLFRQGRTDDLAKRTEAMLKMKL